MHFETDLPIDGDSASLPDTMACLLGTAIDDARTLDRTCYTPHYDKWHRAGVNTTCFVCLGGAMIAGTLEIPPTDSVTIDSFDNRTRSLLAALDDMRNGRWNAAFTAIYRQEAPLPILHKLQQIPAPSHSSFYGWKDFDAHLNSLERLLPLLREIDRMAVSL